MSDRLIKTTCQAHKFRSHLARLVCPDHLHLHRLLLLSLISGFGNPLRGDRGGPVLAHSAPVRPSRNRRLRWFCFFRLSRKCYMSDGRRFRTERDGRRESEIDKMKCLDLFDGRPTEYAASKPAPRKLSSLSRKTDLVFSFHRYVCCFQTNHIIHQR